MRISTKSSRARCDTLPSGLAVASLLFFAGSAPVIAQNHGAMMTSTAVLVATSGSAVSGTLKFHEARDRVVRITGTVEGLTPGKHGFHVHVNGNCDTGVRRTFGGGYENSSTKQSEGAA